jgi:hypothetical protein
LRLARIGRDRYAAGGGFEEAQALPGLPGRVDDVRIYDGVLSAKEVQAVYDAGQQRARRADSGEKARLGRRPRPDPVRRATRLACGRRAG